MSIEDNRAGRKAHDCSMLDSNRYYINRCNPDEIDEMYEIINDAAQAYKGVIPEDRWKEPYMSREELAHEIEEGVLFWGYKKGGNLLGIMGIQDKNEVILIRHAYVRSEKRGQGIGSLLLEFLIKRQERPVLIGTWADAYWAVSFYEKNGFKTVSDKEKNILLKEYWDIPDRQIETSVVLADEKWFKEM